jgi:hypothetical protein
MGYAEVRIGEADDEISAIFEDERWAEAESQAKTLENGVMYALHGPDRRAATALLETIAEGELKLSPTDSLTDSNRRFYKENYKPGTLFGFSVGYLRRSTFPENSEGERERVFKNPGHPRHIVHGNPTEQTIPSVTDHFRQVVTKGGWEVSDSTYTAYDWFGIVLDNAGGKRDLFALSDTGGGGISRLLFPKHDPPIVGHPTITLGVDTHGALVESYEHISRLDVYEYPLLWDTVLKKYGPSKLGRIATGVKTKAKDIIK